MSDLWVEAIPTWATKQYILHVHYARRMPCVQYAFGLFKDQEMIGCVTYGQPASPSLCKGIAGEKWKKRVLELNRLVIAPEYNGSNYGSLLVSKSLKMLPNGTYVVSYADWGKWGHVGYIYQATNWMYSGMTTARTDIFSEGHSRHYHKGETRRVNRSAKHRYIYIVADKRLRKKMLNDLNYPIIQNYPKGESKHYDIMNPTATDERRRDDSRDIEQIQMDQDEYRSNPTRDQ